MAPNRARHLAAVPDDLAVLDATIALARARMARAAARDPAHATRAALRALLDTLQEHPDLTWSWVAHAGRAPIAARRAAVDRALAAALPLRRRDATRTVADAWWVVHERLWRYRDPALPEIENALLALIGVHAAGVAAVAPELTRRPRPRDTPAPRPARASA